jgi:hypothetical protein
MNDQEHWDEVHRDMKDEDWEPDKDTPFPDEPSAIWQLQNDTMEESRGER